MIAEIETLNLWEVLALAIVQGIAEFLPISSSGHIVVGSNLLGKTFDIVELNIVLHAGTLLSILLFYRKEIVRLVTQEWGIIPKIVVGTLPAVVVGLSLKKLIPWLLEDATLSGFMFLITGFLLLGLPTIINRQIDDNDDDRSGMANDKGKTARSQLGQVSWTQAIVVGCFQAAAVLPGISRSGATIVSGCIMGLHRQQAATFSFLLAIPVILGATLLEGMDILEKGPSTSPLFLVAGFLLSFAVGLGSLALLVRWLGKGQLHLFAYYLIPLGIAVVVWQVLAALGVFS